MAEFQEGLWAPWRMRYIERLEQADATPDAGCFLCHYCAHPDHDDANHVVWRTPRTLTVLNLYPYTNGHLLVTPVQHAADPDDLDDATWRELGERVRDARRVLQHFLNCHGFNIGLNLGRAAGAGLPDHLHWHIVPRWSGDTNFMTVLSDVRVLPQSLEEVAANFRAAAEALDLPRPA